MGERYELFVDWCGPYFRGQVGRPEDRRRYSRAVFDVPTTRALIERLEVDGRLWRLCGWSGGAGAGQRRRSMAHLVEACGSRRRSGSGAGRKRGRPRKGEEQASRPAMSLPACRPRAGRRRSGAVDGHGDPHRAIMTSAGRRRAPRSSRTTAGRAASTSRRRPPPPDARPVELPTGSDRSSSAAAATSAATADLVRLVSRHHRTAATHRSTKIPNRRLCHADPTRHHRADVVASLGVLAPPDCKRL